MRFGSVKSSNYSKIRANTGGFTLVELIISVAIFVFMTVLLVSKYGNFSNGILTTNIAYDIAITIRQSQAFGLHVRQTNSSFSGAYGTHFTKASSGNTKFELFFDANSDSVFTSGPTPGVVPDETLAGYVLKRNSIIQDIAVGTGPANITAHPDSLNVVFKRPDPDAIITAVTGGTKTKVAYAEIILKGPDASTRKIVVRRTGQISIEK